MADRDEWLSTTEPGLSADFLLIDSPLREESLRSRQGNFMGAGRENRTLTMSPLPNFESGASTSSAIPAMKAKR